MLEETGNHVRTFTISCAGGSYALDSVHIQYNPIWIALSADLLENCGRVRKIIMYIFFWKEIDWNEKHKCYVAEINGSCRILIVAPPDRMLKCMITPYCSN